MSKNINISNHWDLSWIIFGTVLDIITFQKRVFLYKFIAFTHGCKQIAIISQAFPYSYAINAVLLLIQLASK